jgi:hypothetical protein
VALLTATRSRAIFVCALVALSILCSIAWAAEPQRDHAVKAAFLYRFTGYVDWPPSALAAPAFTIAVLEAPEVERELQRVLSAHTVKGLPAQVRRLETVADIGEAQMVYVGRGYAGDLRSVARTLGARPVLIVTDDRRGLEQGAVINFLLVDRRVRFEISMPAAERAGLKINVELLAVAARVRSAASPHAGRCNESSRPGAVDECIARRAQR